VTELHIPASSFAPYRYEPGNVIDPKTRGRADIAMLKGTALEVIEVKEATWGG
jgi:hypothetical protein